MTSNVVAVLAAVLVDRHGTLSIGVPNGVSARPHRLRCAPHGRRRRDHGQDRRAVQAARLHLPRLGDLRRARLHLRLRPLRRPAQAQRQGRVVAGDARRARRHRRARLGDHPAPARRGRPAATSPASPTRWSTAAPAGSASAPTTSTRARRARSKPSKHPGEAPDCDLTEAREFNLMFETTVGPVKEAGVDRLPAPRDRAGHLPQLQERPAVRAQEAAVRHRPGRQVVPQRDHAGQLHLPHARVRADGDGVLRPARRGAAVVRALARGARCDWYVRPRHPRRPPAPARRTTPTSSATTRAAPATSSTSSRSAGPSSRASPTAATSTSPSTPSTPARSSSTSTTAPASATSRT